MKRNIIIMLLVSFLSACDEDSTETERVEEEGGPTPVIVESGRAVPSSMFPVFQISSDGTYLDAYAQVRLHSRLSDVYLSLAPGDALWFSKGESFREADVGDDLFSTAVGLDETNKKMSRNAALSVLPDTIFTSFFSWAGDVETGVDQPWYAAEMTYADENQEYQVGLFRADQSLFTLVSKVILPADFSITAPLNSEVIDPVNDVVLRWQPISAGNTVDIVVAQLCVDSPSPTEYVYSAQADVGEFILPAGTFLSQPDHVCEYTFQMTRHNMGTLNSAFGGGSIRATQIRKVTTRDR